MKNGTKRTAAASLPLISVIVPVYNVEQYLERCVDSILAQTYDNLEIILVDDGSTDSSGTIIADFAERDERIVKVTHEENRGLFQARVSGVDASHGAYVAFVDSDDYVSIDWFRMLVQNAESTGADIVVGEWCYDNSGKNKSYLNLDPFRIKDYHLEGDEVLGAFMAQEGRCFSWTVVWNKLYRRSLWDRCEAEFHRFSREHGHMLKRADIAFSAGFWTRAKKVTNVHDINYYYYQHEGASTAKSKSRKWKEKSIRDSSGAMDFMKEQLTAAGAFEREAPHYNAWIADAVSILYSELVLDPGDRRYERMIRDAFGYEAEIECGSHEVFFSRSTSLLQESFHQHEQIKAAICSPTTKVVSFDVFDTLICRPFLEPSDLFFLLSDFVNEDQSSIIGFAQLRKHAEYLCREKQRLANPSCEDITLDQIYEEIEEETGFSPERIRRIKEKEIQLELELCKARNSGRELYELAGFAGKRIVLCSDMYLPADVIRSILNGSGYEGWEKLYLSCELGRTKHTGNLYRYMLKDLGLKDGRAVCHIGDNSDADVVQAKNRGIAGMLLPSASNMFRGFEPGIYSGELYSRAFIQNRGKEDYALMLQDYPAARCMLAFSANKVFDNPYVSFNAQSDFNGDPAYVGYAALGPHLMSLAKWVEKRAAALHAGTVHFVARDGYMVKKAFDMLNRSPVKSNYIRLSRQSLLLADVNEPSDVLSLFRKINPWQCSPEKLISYLHPIIPPEKLNSAQSILKAHRFLWTHSFGDDGEFYRCIRVILEEIADFSRLPIYKEKLRQYFSQQIQPGDSLFDVGYSGRPEAALSNLLGFPVGSFYIHDSLDIAEKRRAKFGCHNECFYPFRPKITGVMREHLLMEPGPSTIGYAEKDGVFQPVFEKYAPEYCSAFVTSVMHENALRFIEDWISTWGDMQDRMIIPISIQSAALEYYLHYSKPFDREVFSTLPFEDSLGQGEKLKALDCWNSEIAARGVWQADVSLGDRMPDELRDLYTDGLFVKLYAKLNKLFPKGSRARGTVKRIASLFLR